MKSISPVKEKNYVLATVFCTHFEISLLLICMSLTNKITNQIKYYLFTKGIFSWRQNTLPIPLPNGGFRPTAKTGISDIIAILPPRGRFLGIEIKTGRDRLRPEQLGFKANVERMGGIYMEVKNFEDFKIALDKFLFTV
jgi:hypothetical protein